MTDHEVQAKRVAEEVQALTITKDAEAETTTDV